MGTTRKVNPEDFRRLVAAGVSGADIRKAFGITATALTYWRNRLGVPPLWWKKLNPSAVSRMVGEGKTDREIATSLGVHRNSVKRVRQGLRLPCNSERSTADYRRRMSETIKKTKCGDPAKRKANGAAMRAALAGLYGLPPGTKPVQVRIVLALSCGPLSIASLADRCERPTPKSANTVYDRFQSKSAATGNHLSDLKVAGLIFSARVKRTATYSLTPHCLDLLASATTDDARRTDSGRGAGGEAAGPQTDDPAGR